MNNTSADCFTNGVLNLRCAETVCQKSIQEKRKTSLKKHRGMLTHLKMTGMCLCRMNPFSHISNDKRKKMDYKRQEGPW